MDNQALMMGGLILLGGGIAYYYLLQQENGNGNGPIPCSSYKNQTDCVNADCYWWSNNTCNASEEPVNPDKCTLTGTAMSMRFGELDDLLPGVTIKATNDATNESYYGYSNNEGTWIISNIELGVYTIEASKPSYQTKVSKFVQIVYTGVVPVGVYYSALKYMPVYTFTWSGNSAHMVVFNIPEKWRQSGKFRLTGSVKVDECWIDIIRELRAYAIAESEETTEIWNTGWDPWGSTKSPDEFFYSDSTDPLVAVAITGCCGGVIACNVPALRSINLKCECVVPG